MGEPTEGQQLSAGCMAVFMVSPLIVLIVAFVVGIFMWIPGLGWFLVIALAAVAIFAAVKASEY